MPPARPELRQLPALREYHGPDTADREHPVRPKVFPPQPHSTDGARCSAASVCPATNDRHLLTTPTLQMSVVARAPR
jgi:hypothetical protein